MNREWLAAPAYRCLVPYIAFAEPVRESPWFNMPSVEVAYFAGVWRPWDGERLFDQPGQYRRAQSQQWWRLFAIITTAENYGVRPVHDKVMPVIMSETAEQNEWLASGEDSFRLKRPLIPRLLTPTR